MKKWFVVLVSILAISIVLGCVGNQPASPTPSPTAAPITSPTQNVAPTEKTTGVTPQVATTVVIPQTQGCTPQPSGMVAWWPLDETAGYTTVVDIVGSNTGTAGPWSLASPVPVPGQVGGALQFEASNGVQVSPATTLNFGTGPFTIDAWVQLPGGGGWPIVGKLDKYGATGYYMDIEGNGPPYNLALSGLPGYLSFIGPPVPVLTGTWVFVAATRSGGVVTLYVGDPSTNTLASVVSPVNAAGLIASSTDPLYIGEYADLKPPGHQNIVIDELELFNRTLSQTEIQGILNAGSAGKCKQTPTPTLTPPSPPTPTTPTPPPPTPTPLPCCVPPSNMTAWWPLDEQTGTTSTDIAGIPNNGVWINSPIPVVGAVGWALSFNGVNQYVEVPTNAELNVGTSDFSIDAWIRTSSTSGVKAIMDKRTSSPIQGYHFYLYNGNLGLQLADAIGTSYTNYNSQLFVADGKWHHVAVTVTRNNPAGIVFYNNGVASTTTYDPTIRSGSLDNSAVLRIASRSSDTSVVFNGSIDELEIFNRALNGLRNQGHLQRRQRRQVPLPPNHHKSQHGI